MPDSLTWIVWLQSQGAWLVRPMQAITFLGDEQFYLLIAPAIYWCLNPGLGLRTGLFVMTSICLNSAIKIFLHLPRPFWISSNAHALSVESTFGLPSGHSQDAVVLWGTFAAQARRRWAWIVAIGLTLLIGFSRIVLGMHFPMDVLAGWLIGIGLLGLLLKLEKPALSWLYKKRLPARILIAFVTSLLFITINWLVKISLGAWLMPEIWASNIHLGLPGVEPSLAPSLINAVTAAGAFFGLAGGALWIFEQDGFEAGGPWHKRLARFGLGILGVLVIWGGLKAVFPDGDAFIALILRYLRYALVGVWISALAPWVFIRLGLCNRAGWKMIITHDLDTIEKENLPV